MKRPPKKQNIKTSPATLNESTLEANIACEIATLFNSFFNFGYPSRLRHLFDFNIFNFNAFQKRKTKLFRLTPIEENRGGGWDTKISIPKGKDDERAIFIQFKSGSHKDENSIPLSKFNRNIKSPNPYIEFKFNDNKSKNPLYSNNQHQTLRNLADHLSAIGISAKSVMYGFPRISNAEDFMKLEDDLILHTTFLTIDEIDQEAKSAKINLYDKKTHHFRTCYLSENRREIASKTFELKNPSEHINVLYEIFLVKIARFRNTLVKHLPIDYVNIELFLILADYLKIDLPDSIDLSRYYDDLTITELKNYFKNNSRDNENIIIELFQVKDFTNNPFQWKKELFNRIVHFLIANKELIDIQSIPSEYTFPLNNDKVDNLSFEIYTDVNLLVF